MATQFVKCDRQKKMEQSIPSVTLTHFVAIATRQNVAVRFWLLAVYSKKTHSLCPILQHGNAGQLKMSPKFCPSQNDVLDVAQIEIYCLFVLNVYAIYNPVKVNKHDYVNCLLWFKQYRSTALIIFLYWTTLAHKNRMAPTREIQLQQHYCVP